MSKIRKLVDEEKFVNGSVIDVKEFFRQFEREVDRKEEPTLNDFIEFLIKTGVNNPKGRYLIFDVNGYVEYNIGGMGDFILRINNLENFTDALSTLGKMKNLDSLECFDLETNTNMYFY